MVGRPPPRRNVISFRASDLERIRLEGLRATFPDPTYRSVFEWLLNEPAVIATIVTRMERAPSLWDEAAPEQPEDDSSEREGVFADLGYVR